LVNDQKLPRPRRNRNNEINNIQPLRESDNMKDQAKSGQINKVKIMFRKLVNKIFGGLIEYSFLGGSIAFGVDTNSSDIDCIVVLKDEVYKDIEIREKIKRFADGYVKLHHVLGRIPDLSFPGDIITVNQKEEAITGRGLVYKGKIELPPISENGDWDKQNVDYRVWLTEIAFANNTFLTGNQHRFRTDSLRAVDTIAKFLLLLNGGKKFDPESICNEIFKRGKSFLGLSDRYRPVLEKLLLEKLKVTFAHLERSGFIVETSNNLYVANTMLIKKWKSEVLGMAKKIETPYLLSWKELRNQVHGFNYNLSKNIS